MKRYGKAAECATFVKTTYQKYECIRCKAVFGSHEGPEPFCEPCRRDMNAKAGQRQSKADP